MLLPVEEIVSINLLDTTDSYLATHDIAAQDLLQASRLAFVLSYNRSVAQHNLHAAYGKLVALLMKRSRYSQALKFAKASRDAVLLNAVGHNGAVHEIKRHNYTAARRFAQHALKRDALVRQSYEAAFFDEQKKLGTTLTAETIKKHTGTIRRMRELAKKSGNKKLIEHANSLMKLAK
jgi:hypothetical protein